MRTRRRRALVVLMSTVMLIAVVLVPQARTSPRAGGADPEGVAGAPAPSASRSPSPPPVPTLRPRSVDVQVDGFLSWALLDRGTGTIAGSDNLTATSSTESMIKTWIVADFLRRTAATGADPTADQLSWASTAIRDSDDTAAQRLFNLGGGAPVISRLISTCGLTDTRAVVPPGSSVVWWSYTEMSARDAVRMGACIADGRAAGDKWTQWLLAEMSQVRGTAAAQDQQRTRGGGRWGIIDGLPAAIIAEGVGIKNGWTLHASDGNWHVNCLAVHRAWVLAVMMQYPGANGLQYGADACRKIAEQLVSWPNTGRNPT